MMDSTMREFVSHKTTKQNFTPTKSSHTISTSTNTNETSVSLKDKLKIKHQKNSLSTLTNTITNDLSVATLNEREINVLRPIINNNSTPSHNNHRIYLNTDEDKTQLEHQNYNYNYRYQNYSSSHGKSSFTKINSARTETEEQIYQLSISNQANSNNFSPKIRFNLTNNSSNKQEKEEPKFNGLAEKKSPSKKSELSHIKKSQDIIARRHNKSISINVHSKGLEKDENISEDTQNILFSVDSKSYNFPYENSIPASSNIKNNITCEIASKLATFERLHPNEKMNKNLGINMNTNTLTKEQITNIQFNNNIKYLEQSLRKKIDFSRESMKQEDQNRTLNFIERNDPQSSPHKNIKMQSLNLTIDGFSNDKDQSNLSNYNNPPPIHPFELNLSPQNLGANQDKVMNLVLDLKNKIYEKESEIIELKNNGLKHDIENQNLLMQVNSMILENKFNEEKMRALKIQLDDKEKELISKKV